mmetsp:Transcript_47636/g.77246  ORF Transcript_47636/g.77246 Transcript_47636/m.77246 type:complete len:202 (-) Transcript_47636:206-811(-)
MTPPLMPVPSMTPGSSLYFSLKVVELSATTRRVKRTLGSTSRRSNTPSSLAFGVRFPTGSGVVGLFGVTSGSTLLSSVVMLSLGTAAAGETGSMTVMVEHAESPKRWCKISLAAPLLAGLNPTRFLNSPSQRTRRGAACKSTRQYLNSMSSCTATSPVHEDLALLGERTTPLAASQLPSPGMLPTTARLKPWGTSLHSTSN